MSIDIILAPNEESAHNWHEVPISCGLYMIMLIDIILAPNEESAHNWHEVPISCTRFMLKSKTVTIYKEDHTKGAVLCIVFM